MPVRKSSEIKLLDAVDELVFTRGIEATPVDAVLARAGVSAATLYRGYRSKEALVAAALERRQLRWQEMWDRAIADADSDEQRLLCVFDAIDEFAERPDGARWCAFLGTAAELTDPPVEIADAVARDTDHLRTTLRHLAARLPVDDPHALADSLLLVVSGQLAMRLRASGRRRTTTAKDVAAAVLASALQKRTTSAG